MVVIGIDQSYKRCGISKCKDGKLKIVKSINFPECKCNTDKRKYLINILTKILQKEASKDDFDDSNIMIIVERIRLSSQGFLSQDYIKSTGALIATIIDVAKTYNIKVFSVDTRAWKSQVIGTSKGITEKKIITKGKNKGKVKMIENKKILTQRYITKLGFDVMDDDDAADSAGIALFYFKSKEPMKFLKEEKY